MSNYRDNKVQECGMCKKLKKWEDFGAKTRNVTGYQTICKECKRLDDKKRYAKPPEIKSATKYLTSKEVSKYLGIGLSTVLLYARQGMINSKKNSNGARVFDIDEIECKLAFDCARGRVDRYEPKDK